MNIRAKSNDVNSMPKYLLNTRNLFFFCVSSVIFHGSVKAQKPCIDTGTINKWSGIEAFEVSNNGKYFSYYIEDHSGIKLILQPTSLKWKMILEDARSCKFLQNSEKALFLQKDSLGMIDLNDNHVIHYTANISDFQLVNYGKNDDLLFYRLKAKPDELIVRDIGSGIENRFSNVEVYWNSPNGNVLVLETKSKMDSLNQINLTWVDISDDSVYQIWKGRAINTLLLDEKGLQCAFTGIGVGDSSIGIWHYQRNDNMAEKILDDQSAGMEKGCHIQDITTLNGEDNRVFFNLKKDTGLRVKDGLVPVDIWSYKDASLQSAQLHHLQERLFYNAALNITDKKVIRLEYDRENMVSPVYAEKSMRFSLVVKDGDGDVSESGWNSRSCKSVYLVSLKDGRRILINDGLPFDISGSYILSYNENYVYYYDARSQNYYSYCTRDSTTRNLTSSLRERWTDLYFADWPSSSYWPYHVARLVKNEDAMLVYSQHAIYTLDPAAKTPAVNLTSLRQEDNNLEIKLLSPQSRKQYIDRHEQIIFSVFNRRDKKEALFQSAIDSLKYWRTFLLQPYHFYDFEPVKARDTDLYFVTRMTAETSPNIYMTSNFRSYQSMTDLYPERAYNWMQSELITWKTLDGQTDQGILYKPENFDPLKKYPLLVFYYERLSDGLHHFLLPAVSTGQLNIPMYVSNGYLVFVPDIHYTIGWPGRSAYNAVISGVNYLCRRKYVDRARMGLQGHSFGGFETNYIITHTHLFAAAMSASGMSDFISAYGSIIGDGTSRQRQYEMHRDRIGVTLWQKTALYIENSPVLLADKVATPLLMLANKDDGDVPYQQGIELFTALRRLGKRAWMLQYDGQGHNVFGKAALDLTVRMFQFFNYYLMRESPPIWMTNGVPARLKGIENGLQIDTSGAQP